MVMRSGGAHGRRRRPEGKRERKEKKEKKGAINSRRRLVWDLDLDVKVKVKDFNMLLALLNSGEEGAVYGDGDGDERTTRRSRETSSGNVGWSW